MINKLPSKKNKEAPFPAGKDAHTNKTNNSYYLHRRYIIKYPIIGIGFIIFSNAFSYYSKVGSFDLFHLTYLTNLFDDCYYRPTHSRVIIIHIIDTALMSHSQL